MKILQVIGSLDVGGAERVFIDMCNILYDNGSDVSILFTRVPGEMSRDINPKIPAFSLNRNRRFSFRAIRKLINTVNKFDIIHVHLRYNFIFVHFFSIFFSKNIKFIFHDHHGSIDIDKNIPFFFNFIKKQYTYIGVSQSLCDWAINSLGINKENVFKLSNIRVVNESRCIKKNRRDNLELVHVSNVHPIKNIELSVSITKELNKRIDARLTIYGKLSDELYYKKLIQRASANGIINKIKFIFNENNIPSVLHKYDFALCTSKSESGPLVLIEYLSMGLPFLSYKTGEVANQVIDTHPYLIMTNLSIDKWVEQILYVREMDISENLYDTYQTDFSTDKYYDQLLKIYANAKK